jgi:hypothetical protein
MLRADRLGVWQRPGPLLEVVSAIMGTHIGVTPPGTPNPRFDALPRIGSGLGRLGGDEGRAKGKRVKFPPRSRTCAYNSCPPALRCIWQ